MHLPRFPRQDTRRESGIRVGFLEHDGNAAAPCEPERRPRCIAAGADRENWSLDVEHADCGAPHPPQGYGPTQVAPPGSAIDRLEWKQVIAERVRWEDL